MLYIFFVLFSLLVDFHDDVYARKMIINFSLMVILSCLSLTDKYCILKIEIFNDKEKELRNILNIKTDEERRVDSLFSSFKDYLSRKEGPVLQTP